jgi:hypothetical protein
MAVVIAFHNECDGPLRLQVSPRERPIDVPESWHKAVREMLWSTMTTPEKIALAGRQAAWRMDALTAQAVDERLHELEQRVNRGELSTLDALAQAFSGEVAA